VIYDQREDLYKAEQLVPRRAVAEPTKHDPVNHPSHYTDGKIEVIEFIEDKKLNFNLGNAVKYISRAGKKRGGPDKEVEDLQKAIWYLQREIGLISGLESKKSTKTEKSTSNV
jgi:hypothetical protein